MAEDDAMGKLFLTLIVPLCLSGCWTAAAVGGCGILAVGSVLSGAEGATPSCDFMGPRWPPTWARVAHSSASR